MTETDLAAPLVPTVRRNAYRELGEQCARACVEHAARQPEAVRASLGDLLAHAGETWRLLDRVGWQAREPEVDVRVEMSEAFRRASAPRRDPDGEWLVVDFSNRVLRIQQFGGE